MTLGLEGQLIGSIRRVWFEPAGGAAATGNPGTTLPPGRSCSAIEIETKAGRYAHLLADPELQAIRLCPGAARAPQDQALRHWRDLTAVVPAAFDGRPTIAAVLAVQPTSAAAGDHAARAWRLVLSTGAVLCCRLAAGELEFAAAGE